MSVPVSESLPSIVQPSSDYREGDAFQIKPESKPVYRTLAQHQIAEDAWDLHSYLAWLQAWSLVFVSEFDLGVSELSLSVDWLRGHCLGHFREGHNGFGLKAEIAINRRHLSWRKPWQVLGTLLHELLHAWQDRFGKPGKWNYHNVEFRTKAAQYGLLIDSRGVTQYQPNSPFFAVLAKYDFPVPEIPEPTAQQSVARTKLKKWSCNCNPPVNVRVARADFHALCLHCNHEFVRAD